MNVLLTGGLGYIGSHVAVELMKAGHSVGIIDNLKNSKIEVLDKIYNTTGKRPDFQIVDVRSRDIDSWMDGYDAVIHLAGLKSVAESVLFPQEYFDTNVTGTLNVMRYCIKHEIKKVIFSSSATVYGNSLSGFGVLELDDLNPTNPYGLSKKMAEEIVDNIAAAYKIDACSLRYFNPIGAHESGIIREDPNGFPNNLMPILCKSAANDKRIRVFGTNWNTPDGTCVRDYIHVVDQAKAHVLALEAHNEKHAKVYNVGTGVGTSVLELIKAFEVSNGIEFDKIIADRRPGDCMSLVCILGNIEQDLGWKPEKTIEDMCVDSWNAYKMSAL